MAGTTKARNTRKTRKARKDGSATAKKTASRKSAKRAKAPASPLGRIRAICLALPNATEVETWGEPTFRVKSKLFAMFADANNHHGGGRPSVWIYSDALEQDFVIRSRPGRYFKPPYVGPYGWIGAWLDKSPPWREIAELLRDGHERRAKK